MLVVAVDDEKGLARLEAREAKELALTVTEEVALGAFTF